MEGNVTVLRRMAVRRALFPALALILALLAAGCSAGGKTYADAVYPLEREGVALHLDRMSLADKPCEKNILLVHGLTYSSHEFDVDYADYSLARYLARAGYAVWRLDIAGYGQSGAVADGFLPDTDYAARDVAAAVDAILADTGAEQIDLLGWSWGTVVASRFAYDHPETIRKLVLYAPIFSGLGEAEVTEPFHTNDWAHAADDFQKKADGSLDLDMTEKEVIGMYCSGCWRYDGDFSPNGGRRDLCVSRETELIDPGRLRMPTLVICGDSDPYMDPARVENCMARLPEGSQREVIPGGGHALMLEQPFYRTFREKVTAFLGK